MTQIPVELPPSLSASSDDNSYKKEVLHDYYICCISREASLLARKEVLTGKAKFGITGDGKEVPQVALARAVKNGDWRSGYYRDQTMMFALGISTVKDFFSQLYADAENDPFSSGRQMNNHFATEMVNPQGEWTNQLDQFNVSSDVSCTGGQMARAVGLSMASKVYRQNNKIDSKKNFSDKGAEVCICTIGDASTSEGVFWESLNAVGVMQIPLAISVWDDGYGISVPTKYQTTKGSISEVLKGFYDEKGREGINLKKIKGWDYQALRSTYESEIEKMRATHQPAVFHIIELTQPQGHSTSGSHERYKSKERLQWEKEYDCIAQMKKWIVKKGYATVGQLDNLHLKAKAHVKAEKKEAWKNYTASIQDAIALIKSNYKTLLKIKPAVPQVVETKNELNSLIDPLFGELVQNVRRMLYFLDDRHHEQREVLSNWLEQAKQKGHQRYHTDLYSDSEYSALNIPVVPAKYADEAKKVNGFQILNACFDAAIERDPRILAFGEDVGHIGDVNQGFAGLQEKYGEERVFDTGIREWTIMGQAIGLAMRGLRPIAEIQYLDYLIYGLEPLSDDLATLRYRSGGRQQAPAIIRTRGHRLEGIWHAGSPMGMMINSLRGIYICVPRNMTQAAGFYNTLLQSDDPAIVVECLNGYRLKEKMPENIGELTIPLGVPEVLEEGDDITLVTYGSCVRVAMKAIELLEHKGISVELVDVQTLLPFDLEHRILSSLKKTNRIVFLDEDVPGGATAYMMQKVLEEQGGYQYLDAAPMTLSAKAHRPPYGSDGDYFTKPNPEDIFDLIFKMISEDEPQRF